jgi:hypothetical protein
MLLLTNYSKVYILYKICYTSPVRTDIRRFLQEARQGSIPLRTSTIRTAVAAVVAGLVLAASAFGSVGASPVQPDPAPSAEASFAPAALASACVTPVQQQWWESEPHAVSIYFNRAEPGDPDNACFYQIMWEFQLEKESIYAETGYMATNVEICQRVAGRYATARDFPGGLALACQAVRLVVAYTNGLIAGRYFSTAIWQFDGGSGAYQVGANIEVLPLPQDVFVASGVANVFGVTPAPVPAPSHF